MIAAMAIVLFVVTALAWVWVVMPHLVTAWLSFARDLDPSRASQHAVLFSPAPPSQT